MPVPPAHLASLLLQAVGHHQAGATALAERAYGQVLAISPHHLQANYNLSLLLAESGRPRDARRRLEGLTKRYPAEPAPHYTLGKLFEAEGVVAKAVFHLRRSLELDPAQLDLHLDLIRIFAEQGRLDDARQVAASGLARFPDAVDLPTQIGIAALRSGQSAEAQSYFEQALRLTPNDPKALYNLGNALDAQGELHAALHYYHLAEAADPEGTLPPVYLGHMLLRSGDVERAVAESDAWLETHPDDRQIIANRLMAEQYRPGVTAAGLMALHRMWDERVGLALRPPRERHLVSPDPDRRLRVGVVSADFRSHAVGVLTIRAFEALDPDLVDLVAYSSQRSQLHAADPIAARFRACMPGWRDTAGWGDARLADEIRRDRIDVLIDLSGHTSDWHLAAFARRPAPVQVTWAGYFGTTGASAIDWLIADRFLLPEGEEDCYVEAPLRLPDGYLCFDTTLTAPPVSPLPAGDTRPLTFAAFHNPSKINRDVVALWSRILREQPGSRISLMAGAYEIPEVAARVRAWFESAGANPDRLDFTGNLPRQDYLRRLGETDITLDPFPYSGGAVTCDSLWMGVPVITWPGWSFAGRHSQSHLHAAGVTGTIAANADDYCAIVRDLDRDRTRLAGMRAGMRAGMAASPLCDAPRFAGNLQAALRRAWQAWCARQ